MLILTVSQILDRAYMALRENGADPTHWTKPELLSYLNDCLMDIAEYAMCFKTFVGIEVKEGKRRYKLPDNMLLPIRIEWDGEQLEEASYEDLDNHDRDWRSRTGDPLVWFVELAPPGYIDVYRLPDADGDDTVMSSEYGTITDISDGTNTYTFQDEDEAATDYGVIISISSDGDQIFEMDDDYGIITGYFSNAENLVVHGYGYPDEITDFNATLPRPVHGNYQVAVDFILSRAFLKEGPTLDTEKATIFRAAYMEGRNRVRTKPRTSSRRRFVRRQQQFEITRVIGPGVPTTIEES